MGPPLPNAVTPGIRLGCCGAAQYRNSPTDVVTLDVMTTDFTPQEVSELLDGGGDVQLIDVREPDEYERGRIAGARLLPLGDLVAQAETIDRDRPIVFYCRSGSRSAMATEAFLGAGFDAHNMTGGLLDWDTAGLPLEPEGGRVAD